MGRERLVVAWFQSVGLLSKYGMRHSPRRVRFLTEAFIERWDYGDGQLRVNSDRVLSKARRNKATAIHGGHDVRPDVSEVSSAQTHPH